MVFLSIVLYTRFASRQIQMTTEAAEQLLTQTTVNLEDYLVNMRRLSDAMYYDVIKDADLARDSIDSELNLLYEAHKDNLISFALFRRDGELVSAAPVATMKQNLDVTGQRWFTEATGQMENLHFSTPHVQNLFDDSSYRYYWVISLSRVVDMTDRGVPMTGVLLVDMNYNTVEQMMNRLNEVNSYQYYYLCDRSGEIIYHPRQMQIRSGNYEENSAAAVSYEDGVHRETFGGEERTVVVSTVSYTGWKLVGVIPQNAFSIGMMSTRYFVVLMILTMVLAILIINRFVSERISRPIMQLDESVRETERAGFATGGSRIFVGGSSEVEHLGRTLQRSMDRNLELMQDVVREQEDKRKSELDALQSQINPHFLYNTLDSIVWMIESERGKDAVFMVTQLASLFRISLSRGRTIISIGDELHHAEYYMNIQKIRYKDVFTVSFTADEEVKQYATVKLIIQPLLENAIYYGVEGMGGDGEIEVHAYRKDSDIYIDVRDNGLGMPEEVVEKLLTEDDAPDKAPRPRRSGRGSGVGLVNVHRRIQLRFGNAYGLEIESEPDEGTTVRIHLPAVPDTEENRRLLEEGKYLSQRTPDVDAGASVTQNPAAVTMQKAEADPGRPELSVSNHSAREGDE